MASPSPEPEASTSSMFMQKHDFRDIKRSRAAEGSKSSSLTNSPEKNGETITVKDFFDFMKTAYQVYENLEGEIEDGSKVNWEELTKLTVINHVIEQEDRDLLAQTTVALPRSANSKSESTLQKCENELKLKKNSYSDIEGRRRSPSPSELKRVEKLSVWTEANLNCKLNDVINEGILDSILPYLVGYKKPTKTVSVYAPIMKKSLTSLKKPASFGSFVSEKESKDRLGRRKSSVIAAAQERANQKQDGEIEIHVCDEVKGLKKDFRCSQKLLISKMGYFADVTAGQRLEDMDISVHCDIQIFDWLMRWVKRDTILVEDWPLLNPQNVIPILVSASFLQMAPLLHDCLIYCHAHMSDIVKTSTNLACLSDALLTRLAAMYTNVELESIKDRKDKMQSRLYCKMIVSLAEPVPETLRGHYATLATLFKCNKCNKLLGRQIAEKVPCQPANMRIDRRGNIISMHTKDPTWSLNEYITWLFGELRSWRRVYWRLWAECHFLKCQLCDSIFPVYQMEWCSLHAQAAQMFATESHGALPVGRYPCCGERAYRFEAITRHTGCQFREHVPDEQEPSDAAVMEIYRKFRDMIAMRPPQLIYPDRVTRLSTKDYGETVVRLQCKEMFWWEGIQLLPPRPPLGLLGKMYTSNTKFNQSARPGSPLLALCVAQPSNPSLSTLSSEHNSDTELRLRALRPHTAPAPDQRKYKKGVSGVRGGGDSGSEGGSDSSSEHSSGSARSDEDAPTKRSKTRSPARSRHSARSTRLAGRTWVTAVSARSNQDAQRRFEERAARQMRAALARRTHPHNTKHTLPSGGIYARLEAEWRERARESGAGAGWVSAPPRPRPATSARARPPQLHTKYAK